MNIVLRELKSIRKSLIIWSFSIIFLVYVGMVKYSGFRESKEMLDEMINSLPEIMKVAFGIGKLDLSQASGYYIVFFLYFALLCGIHAIMQGAIVISKEERDKTADFLFVKPIRRREVITAKLIASLISVIILNLVTLFSSLLIVPLFNTGESISFLILDLMIALFFIQLIFLSIGFLLGVVAKSAKQASGLATGILLGTFILSIVVDFYKKIKYMKYLTPFKYFDGKAIFIEGFNTEYLVLTLIVIIYSISLTYMIYEKKNLHV